jgi:hypothetical protein
LNASALSSGTTSVPDDDTATGLRCAGLSAVNSSSLMPASCAATFTSMRAGAWTVVK